MPTVKDIKRFVSILKPYGELFSDVGFSHIAGQIYERRISETGIFHRLQFEWNRNKRDRVEFCLYMGFLGDDAYRVFGVPVNFPSLGGVSAVAQLERFGGDAFHGRSHPPQYSFIEPLPYLYWFLNDARSAWESWFSEFPTVESMVEWFLKGGDPWGLVIRPKVAPSSYLKVAKMLAYLHRNEEAIEAVQRYWKMLNYDDPAKRARVNSVDPKEIPYLLRFVSDLKTGNHIMNRDYAPD